MSDQDNSTGAERVADEERRRQGGDPDSHQGGGGVIPEGSGKQFAEDQTDLEEVGNPADPDSGKGFAQGQADLNDEPGLPGHPREDGPAV